MTTIPMQTARTTMIGLAGRRTTQPLAALRSPALPLRTQRLRVRAEPGSQGPSTSTASDTVTEGDADVGQQSVPRQKSSWEMIEEPVRGGEGAPGTIPDGGRPVGQRNNQFDDLLINFDGADERSITGLPVAWPDAFRFKGAAPEIINCRLAMLGAFAGLTAELVTGRSIIEQYRMAPLPIAATFLLFAVASLIPISKGIPRKGAKDFGSPLTFLTPDLEVTVGRIAMLGIAGTLLTEKIIGHAVL